MVAAGTVPWAITVWRQRVDLVRPSNLFALIYVLALVTGIVVGLTVGYAARPADLDYDEREYWQMASQLIDGSYALFPRRTAAFPLILAVIRLVSPSLLVAQLLITAIFALSALLLFLLIRRITGSSATGALAGLVFAIWPPTTYFGASLYSETAALPVFLFVLWLLPLGDRAAGFITPLGWRAALGAGVVLAVVTQIRSMYLIFVPFALFAVLIEDRRPRIAVLRAGLVLAGFALTTLPWSIYMTERFGHPILITANGGETLAGGLSPRLLSVTPSDRLALPDRTTWVGPGKWLPLDQNGYLTPLEQRTLPYDQQDALLRKRSLAWAMAHLNNAVYLEFCKLGYMWGFYRMADNGVGQLLFGNVPIITLLLTVLVVLLRRPQLLLRTSRLCVVPLFVSAVALISWGSWRFRQPADAAMIGIAAIGWLGGRARSGVTADGKRPAFP